MPADPHLILGLSGSISGSGDSTILTPPAGQSIRLFYVCLGAAGNNATASVVAVRFGGNTPIYTIPLVPGAIWARNIGAGRFYQQAQAADEVLFLNQGAANTIYWSLEYLTLP